MALMTKPKSFKRFSEIATVHGLYRIGHSLGWIRTICWGFLFSALLCTVITLTSSILIEFFSYPVLTEVHKETRNTMKFPSLTICHSNNFRLSAFKKLVNNFDTLLASLVSSTVLKSLMTGQVIPPAQSDVTKAFISVYTNSSMMKTFSSTAHSIKWNFLDWCTFSMTSNCKYPEDFKDYYYHSTIGFCKTFNFNGSYTQSAPGLPFGVSLKLFINQWDKVPLLSDNGAGVMLMIHPQNVYPNPFAEATLIPTGNEAYISMRKIAFERQKSPYKSNCTNGEGIFLIYPGRYTVINCQYSCFVKDLMERCGYIESAYQYHRPKAFAESLKKISQKNMSIIEMANCIGHIGQNDKCTCPPACYEEKYRMRTSYAQWPYRGNIEYYRSILANLTNRKNITTEDVYQSVISLKVFYDELGYDIIREKPVIKWPDLFSKIGGQLGLWLGASIFSVIEIMAFITHSMMYACINKIQPDQNGVNKIEADTRN